ncbi:site-specific integrase [Acinetobacter thermotolerans]|uniref:site-specific integrase n=1 Tax=Acinetobacter thermotolerans TaxID=3151487 RepID=UPI00325B0839
MSNHPHSLRRKQKNIAQIKSLLKLFSEKFEGITTEDFQSICNEIDQKLLEKSGSNLKLYRIGRLHLAKYIKRLNRANGTDYPIPSTPVIYESAVPLQNIETIKHGKEIVKFVKQLTHLWHTTPIDNSEHCHGFALISAILFNGIWNETELKAFSQIIETTKSFDSFLDSKDHFISLEIPNSQYGNKKIDHPLYTTTYTKMIVIHDIVKCWLFRLNQYEKDLFTQALDPEQIINDCIRTYVPGTNIRYKELIKYAFYYTQFLENAKLDQMSIGLLKHEIPSSSPLKNQLAVYFHQFDTPSTTSRYKALEQNKQSIKGNIESELATFLKDIRAILRTDDYVQRLIELYASDLSAAMERIVFWALIRSKLNTNQLVKLNEIICSTNKLSRTLIHADFQPLKRSSLNTFFSQFVYHWLFLTQDKNVNEFSASDFEEVYTEILELKAEQTRSNTQKRLSEFHHKQVLFFDVPDIDLENLLTVKICKTDLVSPNLFHKILQALESMPGLHRLDKSMFKHIFTLGFRIGLRINETLNIFVNDFQINSDQLTLCIRNHRNKNQKSYSAYRKIPLHHLLKPEEFESFITYIKNRKRQLLENKYSLKQPLFIKQNFKETDEKEVNELLKELLNSVYPEHGCTYHSLRHSAINHIYLVLAESALANHFTDYSPTEQMRIRYALLRHGNTQQTWYALAHFVGHLTPSTTCSSYLHLAHLAITYQLNQMNTPLTKEAYYNILHYKDNGSLPVQRRAIHNFLYQKLTLHPYQQHDHNYKEFQVSTPNTFMLGTYDSDLTFKLLHHILYTAHEGHLLLPETIPLQVARKIRDTAYQLKMTCINQKKSCKLFTTDFIRKHPDALITSLPTNEIEQNLIGYAEKNYAIAYKNHKKDLMHIIEIYLQKVQPNYSEFKFYVNEKRQLKKFLSFINDLFPKKYIHLELSSKVKQELKHVLGDLKLPTQNFTISEKSEIISFSFKASDSNALGIFKLVMFLIIVFIKSDIYD